MFRVGSFFTAAILVLASLGFAADNPNTPADQPKAAQSPAGKKIPRTAGKDQQLKKKKSPKGVAKKKNGPDLPGVAGQRGPRPSGQLPGADRQGAIQEGIDAARATDAANKARIRDGKIDKLGDPSRFDPFNPESQAFAPPDGLGRRGPDDAERDRSRYWGINGAPDKRGQHAPRGTGWAAWGVTPTESHQRRNADGSTDRWGRGTRDGQTVEYEEHENADGSETRTETTYDSQGRKTSEETREYRPSGPYNSAFAGRETRTERTTYTYGADGSHWEEHSTTLYGPRGDGGQDVSSLSWDVDVERDKTRHYGPISSSGTWHWFHDPAPDDNSGGRGQNPLPWWHSRSMWSLSQKSPYELLRDPLSDRNDGRGDRGEGGTSPSGGSSIGSKLGWITDPIPFDNLSGGVGGGGYNDPGPGRDPNPAEPPQPPAPPRP